MKTSSVKHQVPESTETCSGCDISFSSQRCAEKGSPKQRYALMGVTPRPVNTAGTTLNPLVFIKEIARYFMDFLETDFHKQKTPEAKNSINVGISKIMSLVFRPCIVWPFRIVRIPSRRESAVRPLTDRPQNPNLVLSVGTEPLTAWLRRSASMTAARP